MATDEPPAYNADIDSAPPLYDEVDAPTEPSAPVVAQQPAVQQQTQPQPQTQQVVVVQQQPQPAQQVVYVDQNGQPINTNNVQVVVVTQQPQILYPNQQQPAGGVPLQVMNGSQNARPPTDIQSQQDSARLGVSEEANRTVTNIDELPPNYEDIISGKYDQELNANPKDGRGLVAGCAGHKKTWILSIIIWTLLTFGVIMNISAGEDTGLFMFSIFCFAFFAQCWCCYTIEWGCCSSTRLYLSNIHDTEWTYNESQRLKQCVPTIKWHVECYHYRRTTDSKGRTKKKKVVTHRADMNYTFNTWRDLSIDLTGLEEWKLTKLTIYKQFVFGNAMTEQDYRMREAQFKRDNDRDRYQNFSYQMVLDNFEPKILVEANPGTRNQFISKDCFCLFSCLLCSACYRTWFSSNTGKKHYIIQKEISL